jgi:Tetracyclin repressor-like, C-terminal domain
LYGVHLTDHAALRDADRVLAILRTGGVPDALAVAAQRLLISIVNGVAIDETGEGGHPPADRPPPHEAAAMAGDYLASLPSEREVSVDGPSLG